MQSVRDELLVTGFGPFGSHESNPSQILAEGCGLPHKIIEVSFAAAEEFLAEAGDRPLLMLGVHGKAERMCLETTARNWCGKTPDVRGAVHGPAPIDPAGPPQLAATLWPTTLLHEDDTQQPTVDAGDYLCNYLFYRAVQLSPAPRAFLHVPTAERMPLDQQADRLAQIVAAL